MVSKSLDELLKIPDCEWEEEISLYARISVDLEDEEDDNLSIENQLKIMKNEIARRFPKCTYKEYIDRDRSGYTFEERENYQRMKERLVSGQSRILMVKDFSRFARRTGKGLVELEEIKDAGNRIISVSDGIDFPKDDKWFVISFYFVINEQPVTEASRKVKGSITVMQNEGEWLCSVPYGYMIKQVGKKNVVAVVPEEAEVVRNIYQLYAYEGWGYKKIANYLTSKHIPTPTQCYKRRKEENGEIYKGKVSEAWAVPTLQDLLKNDYYIGTYRGHKYTREKINGKDKKLDTSEHIVIKEHHESILDDRLFLFTQGELSRRTSKTTHYRGTKKYDTPYTSYLFCGECGSPMFSRSRPDLAPSYICGTYHKRGLDFCTSHHTRTDFLDGVLKDYVRMVKENCTDIIAELEQAIASEADSVKETEKLYDHLQKQLKLAKEELKATKKQKIKELARNQDDPELIEETFREIEEEITDRIQGLREQIEQVANRQSRVVEIARTSKTVFEVFDNILNKPTLDRIDIGLIVDKILVYESGIVEVKLKADINALLGISTLPSEEKAVNFNFDSMSNLYTAHYSQKVRNQRGKAYTVNVVCEGDPLEIFTDREGEVIFKKYSPIGELADFAGSYAEALSKTIGHPVCITDKDRVISISGAPKRELLDKKIASEIEELMEEKTTFLRKSKENKNIYICEDNNKYSVGAFAPIISEGDSIGSVIIFSEDGKTMTEIEEKSTETAAAFLGRQMDI